MGKQIELGLSLADEATATWNQFVNEVKAGTEEIGRHGKQVSNLSSWIREQRKEQREQNFLFQEARNVIGTVTFAAIGLSEASGLMGDKMRAVNSAVVTGYSAFQALNFAMSALKVGTGAWGLAIQLAAGLAAGFATLLRGTGEAAQEASKQLEEYKRVAGEMAEGIGAKEAQAEISKFDILLSLSAKRLKGAKEYLALAEGAGFERVGKEVLNLFGAGNLEALRESIRLEEMRIAMLRQRREALVDVIAAEEQEAAVKVRKQGVIIEELIAAGRMEELNKLAVQAGLTLARLYKPEGKIATPPLRDLKDMEQAYKRAMNGIEDEAKNAAHGAEQGFQHMDNAMRRTANDMYEFFKGSIQGIRALIRDLVNFVIDEMERLVAEKIAMGIFDALSGFLGSIFGFIGDLFGSEVAVPMGTPPGEIKTYTPSWRRTTVGTPGSFGEPYAPQSQVTVNIYANDAKSFGDMIRQPEHRRKLADAIADASRKGIV
jgi:hypothetical protein